MGMTITQFLKDHVPFLAGLTEEQAHALAKAVEQKPFKKGQTVLFKGVSVEGLHVMATGKVSVHVQGPKGWITAATLGTGDIFGEASIIEFTMAGATIKAEDDNTMIFVIPETAFKELLERDPGLKERTLALIKNRQAGAAAAATKKPEAKKA